MSVRLTLICHAATRAVRDIVFPLDEPLDPQGSAKASRLAADLRRVDGALTSPALRARQTATALRVHAIVDPALRDIDLGRWAGHSFAEIQTVEPEAVAAWTSDPDVAPHGGESITDLLERIAPWLDGTSRNERRIVAVTHPAVIRAAVISPSMRNRARSGVSMSLRCAVSVSREIVRGGTLFRYAGSVPYRLL